MPGQRTENAPEAPLDTDATTGQGLETPPASADGDAAKDDSAAPENATDNAEEELILKRELDERLKESGFDSLEEALAAAMNGREGQRKITELGMQFSQFREQVAKQFGKDGKGGNGDGEGTPKQPGETSEEYIDRLMCPDGLRAMMREFTRADNLEQQQFDSAIDEITDVVTEDLEKTDKFFEPITPELEAAIVEAHKDPIIAASFAAITPEKAKELGVEGTKAYIRGLQRIVRLTAQGMKSKSGKNDIEAKTRRDGKEKELLRKRLITQKGTASRGPLGKPKGGNDADVFWGGVKSAGP